jgi:hypothetical protein
MRNATTVTVTFNAASVGRSTEGAIVAIERITGTIERLHGNPYDDAWFGRFGRQLNRRTRERLAA